MITRLHRLGLRGWHLQSASIGTIGLCVAFWVRAKTLGQDERGNAERRALFIGLWPPMFWLLGQTLDEQATSTRVRSRRLLHR